MNSVQQKTQEITVTLDEHAKQLAEHTKQIESLNVNLQSIRDFTDDLITLSGNVVSHADSLVSVYLLIFSFIITIISFGINWYIGKSKNEHVKEATQIALKEIINGINNSDIGDNKFSDLIKNIINHDEFKKILENNVTSAIDATVKDNLKTRKSDINDINSDINFENCDSNIGE